MRGKVDVAYFVQYKHPNITRLAVVAGVLVAT